MTATQRVDVETALAEVIRLADVSDKLSGDYHEGNRAEADLEWAAVNFVREHAKHIAALLQQLAELQDCLRYANRANATIKTMCSSAEAKLAERDAEAALLRNGAEQEKLNLLTQLHAAERTREEACWLLRRVHGSLYLLDKPHREFGGVTDKTASDIAAFLAANGGRDE